EVGGGGGGESGGGGVGGGGVGGRAVIGLAVAGLQVGDQLRHGPGGNLVVDDQQIGQVHEQRHRLEVALDVVGELGIEEAVEDIGAERAEEQRVAVVRRLRHIAGADAAARTGAVLHHERNAEAHVVLQDARQQVGRAAGRERHHDGHRPLRPVLRRRRRGGGEQGGKRERASHRRSD